jgi:hypothetical protein
MRTAMAPSRRTVPADSPDVLTEEAVCLLDVPVHKTGTAVSKPVDPLVAQAIEAWQALRPAQPTQPNRVRPLRQRPRSRDWPPVCH